MRKVSLALVSLAIVMAGCGTSLKDKVVGTWKIDPPTMKSAALDKLKSDKRIADMIEKSTAAARFEFKKDGTLNLSSTMPGSQAISGTWKAEGEKITITLPNAKPEQTPTFTANSDGSKLHMSQTGPMGSEADLIKAQ